MTENKINMEQESFSPRSDIITPHEVKNLPAPTPNLDFIYSIVGNDILEIFGETGSCKSKFCLNIALEAISKKQSVYFLDTERNLNNNDISKLGKSYTYNPMFQEIIKLVENLKSLPIKPHVVIIDSVGLPILTRYAKLSMKEKGDALLSLIALMGDLKEYAYKNNALVIVTNQPESEFNKQPGTIRQPFGDKSCFVVKEIWKSEKISSKENSTRASIKSFRSRTTGAGTPIFNIEVTDKETKLSR
jgi:RecA/RadA recombinase